MKREYLEGLGIDKGLIDQIMTEHGKDITKLTTERDGYKTQLSDAQKTLKGFEGVDVGELQGKIAALTADLTTKETQFQQQLADMQFTAALERTIGAAKPRSAKAVLALLDVEKLKSSKNQDADITAALEAVKGEHGYLFETGKLPIAPTPGAAPASAGASTGAADTSRANDAYRTFLNTKGEV